MSLRLRLSICAFAIVTGFTSAFSIAETPVESGPDWDTINQQYLTYKKEVLSEFVDSYGLVCNRDASRFIDQGDCGWRTGLLLFCLAIDRDNDGCLRFLKTLSNSWIDGRPVRHPGDTNLKHYGDSNNLYSRDQFQPQLAALYYCYKFGNSDVRHEARQLLERFVVMLQENNWRFNSGHAAHCLPIGRFPIRQVCSNMNLANLWTDSETHEARLWTMNVGIQASIVRLGWRIDSDTFGVSRNADNPMDYYAIHNLFWQILLVQECSTTEPAGLRRNVIMLADACKQHNMAPLLILTGRLQKPVAWLTDWPDQWNHVDYVWQRNIQQQRRAAQDSNSTKRYPRLDYMVLRQLIALQK